MISGIVVLYGATPTFASLLESIQRSAPKDFELIVVVNPAAEAPPEIPDWVHQTIVNDRNVGFGQAVNQAAEIARGEYLLLLNSDVVLPDEWAAGLCRPMANAHVGAVVPMLVDPDGTVQEAGSFIGPQAETVALGRGIAVRAADELCEQIVDYASAACMLVRADAFGAVGGFHPAYGIGYFEDVELAFTLRKQHLHTYLVPSVQVSHVREASFGNSANELMDENRGVFKGRWEAELSGRPHLTDFELRPYRLTHARDWHRWNRLVVVCADTDGLWEGWPTITDRSLEMAVDLICVQPTGEIPVDVRHFSGSLNDWCSTHHSWASSMFVRGGVAAETRASLEDSQGAAGLFHLGAGESLMAGFERLRGSLPG